MPSLNNLNSISSYYYFLKSHLVSSYLARLYCIFKGLITDSLTALWKAKETQARDKEADCVHIVNLYGESSYHFSFPFSGLQFPCILPISALLCPCLTALVVPFVLPQGGNVDLRRVPPRLDPLRRGLGLVSLRTAGLGPHPVLSDPNTACKVCSHVQPHHLPGHWLQVCLLPLRRVEGQELFEEIQVISALGGRMPLRTWCS